MQSSNILLLIFVIYDDITVCCYTIMRIYCYTGILLLLVLSLGFLGTNEVPGSITAKGVALLSTTPPPTTVKMKCCGTPML